MKVFIATVLAVALFCVTVSAVSSTDRLRSKVSPLTPSPDVLQQLQEQLQHGIAETQKDLAALSTPVLAPPAPAAAPLTGGPLVNFLQAEQKAYAAHQQEQASPAASAPEQSLKDMMLLQQQMSQRASAESKAVAAAEVGAHAVAKSKAKGGDFTPCHTCVFVLERIKKGNNMLLPAICSEVYKEWPDSYSDCHQVLNALTYNGNNVRYWLFEGCFKYEVYRAKEWIKPCPSHVMCSVLKNLDGEPFCQALPMEDPFA